MYITEGKKVGLRGLELTDSLFINKVFNNPEVVQYLDNSSGTSKTETEEYIKKSWEKRKIGSGYFFAIIEKRTKKPVGGIHLFNVSHRNSAAEFGVWIDEKYQNKGYGTEAEKLLLEYGFNELNLNSIKASVISSNKRSARVFEKIGMKQTGKVREAVFRHGKYRDMLLFDILKSEFK